MADKSLLYRLDNPELKIAGSGNWIPVSPISRIYAPVDGTASEVVEFDGETRFVIMPEGDARGPWSVAFVGVFDISNYIVEITRMGEM